LRSILLTGTVMLCAGLTSAQPLSHGIVKLTARTLTAKKLGTGVCLDTPCVHVLTSYHVVALLGTGLKVEGVGIAAVVAATGPQDPGSLDTDVAGSVKRFNPAHDLALLTLRQPLPSRFAGLPLANHEPSVGQPVTRIARHDNAIDYALGTVVSGELQYQSADGLVDLTGHFLMDCGSRPGNSGGAVLDGSGRVLGIVEMRSTEANGRIGTAVAGTALISAFLHDNEPALWARLFDKSVVTLAALPLRDLDWPVALDGPPLPAQAADDPDILVDALRMQVATSVGKMRRMTAQQSMRFWGTDQPEQTWQYQVSMYSDGQRFRTVGGKDMVATALPGPRAGILPESEWYDILSGIANVRLKYLGASSTGGKPVHVFAFRNSASDKVCRFRQRTAAFFGHKEDADFVDCDGIVVADAQFQVLGITHRMSPHFGVVAEWRAAARYELSNLCNCDERDLVPRSMDLSAQMKNGKSYYASERWSDYHVFVAQSLLRTD